MALHGFPLLACMRMSARQGRKTFVFSGLGVLLKGGRQGPPGGYTLAIYTQLHTRGKTECQPKRYT
jgi:hypothetical protein